MAQDAGWYFTKGLIPYQIINAHLIQLGISQTKQDKGPFCCGPEEQGAFGRDTEYQLVLLG